MEQTQDERIDPDEIFLDDLAGSPMGLEQLADGSDYAAVREWADDAERRGLIERTASGEFRLTDAGRAYRSDRFGERRRIRLRVTVEDDDPANS